MSLKNSNANIENRTRDLPTCSTVAQPTAPPRATLVLYLQLNCHRRLLSDNKQIFSFLMQSILHNSEDQNTQSSNGARPALFLIFVFFYVFLCCSMYCLFCVVLCIVCVYIFTELLPTGGCTIAVKYIISNTFSERCMGD
jgi:hypothetical protein